MMYQFLGRSETEPSAPAATGPAAASSETCSGSSAGSSAAVGSAGDSATLVSCSCSCSNSDSCSAIDSPTVVPTPLLRKKADQLSNRHIHTVVHDEEVSRKQKDGCDDHACRSAHLWPGWPRHSLHLSVQLFHVRFRRQRPLY